MDEAPATGVWQQRIATILLIIFMVAIALSVPAVWARNQLLDTDRFVRTVAPLAENEDIQEGIINRVSSHISTAIADRSLIERDGAISAAITAATSVAVENATRNVVTSPQFAPLWEEAARVGHSGFEALLTGGTSPYFNSENGQVTIELSAVVAAVQSELANRGLPITLPTTDLQYVLFESDELASLQETSKFLDDLAIILPVVALISLIAYIVLSPNRRGAIVVAALGMATMMAVMLIFLSLARWLYLRNLGETVNKDAAKATFDILTHYLRVGLRILGLVAILVSLVVYLSIRGRLTRTEDKEVERSLYVRWPVLARFENAVATNRVLSVVAWCMLIVAILLLWDWQDIGWAMVLLVAGAAGVVLVFRAKPMPPELLAPRPEVSKPSVPPPGEAITQNLQQLSELKNQGLLSDEEFARAKSTVLGMA